VAGDRVAPARQDAGLQAKTIWAELNQRHGDRFSAGQLRTLQRRLLAWRLKEGPDRDVFFSQTHVPGEQGQSDFTDMRELGVVIAGETFAHLLYHFVLTYSNWESVSICPSESFEALSAGMQTAFWRLGGVPAEHRTDNLSAATHELAGSRGRDFTERYSELINHYELRASRNFPGNANENGDVESANGHLKNAIDQQLRLRGSRAFVSREAYEGFLAGCIQARNATRAARIEEERPHLRPLPKQSLPTYRETYATVSRCGRLGQTFGRLLTTAELEAYRQCALRGSHDKAARRATSGWRRGGFEHRATSASTAGGSLKSPVHNAPPPGPAAVTVELS
jgi:transposase